VGENPRKKKGLGEYLSFGGFLASNADQCFQGVHGKMEGLSKKVSKKKKRDKNQREMGPAQGKKFRNKGNHCKGERKNAIREKRKDPLGIREKKDNPRARNNSYSPTEKEFSGKIVGVKNSKKDPCPERKEKIQEEIRQLVWKLAAVQQVRNPYRPQHNDIVDQYRIWQQ